ncbi:NAD-dependent epimerase/dehydratase family protein [Burkholderiaceae bacterium]|nr:NAD-dependent epimerase/dehydratase family protein [Burkholderiaceae bacterium]
MLSHLRNRAMNPHRVVVLGAGGFIGGAILRKLKVDGIPTEALGRPALDLLQPHAADLLAAALSAKDTLIFASAKAPCKDLAMLRENTLMVEVVCAALKKQPVEHVVYISSDAVYKDSPKPITENSCAEPGSIHGLMHLTREVALHQEFDGPLAIVRPTLVYGYDDPHNGYGPNRFRRLVAAGEDITLFGEGEEQRDHVDVEDVADLVRLIVLHRSCGVANAVSGEVVSFRELAEFAIADLKSSSRVKGTPRLGAMPHNGFRPFDNTALIEAFPDFRFKGWRQGLSAVHARQMMAGAKV